MTWTPDMIDRLSTLYQTGMTYAHIAKELGVTRNAISGVVNRQGASLGIRPERPKAPPKPRPSKDKIRALFQPRESAGRPLRHAPVVPLHLSFDDLERGQCKFPYSAQPPFTFCGNETGGETYCAEHHALCWHKQPAKPRTGWRKMPQNLGSRSLGVGRVPA